MATRSYAEASSKSIRKVVPGSVPAAPTSAPAAAKPNNKKKGGPKASKTDESVKVTDAAAAALITKAPENPSEVASDLKVTAADLAEQSEKETAIAAVAIVEEKEQQTATAAQAKDDALAKTTLAKESSAEEGTSTSPNSQLVLLLQFLHLFNLFHPNPASPPSFAPSNNMPEALQMSTGQEVAALGKIYDQLANGPLQGGGGDALEILASIESGSDKQVLPDVTYGTVRDMILKLTAPPAEAPKRESKAVDTEKPQSDVIDQAGQEPEGGQPDAVPTLKTGPTAKGIDGGAGITLGSSVSTNKADGSAAAQVAEPINTTEISKDSTLTPTERKFNWADVGEEDDDDLGEAPVFEPVSPPAAPAPTSAWSSNKRSAPVSAAPASGVAKSAASDATAPTAASRAPEAAAPAVSTTPSTENATTPNLPKENKAKSANGQVNGKNSSRNPAPADNKPVVKAQPKVDDDGFIVQESKRTRYLQQKQQQQQQNRTGGRGGARGGANGNRGGARQVGPPRKSGKGNAADSAADTNGAARQQQPATRS